MNWYKVFYWMTIADNIKTVMGLLATVFGAYTILATVCSFGVFEFAWSQWAKSSKLVYIIGLLTFLTSLTLWTFTPSKKDCMLIIAGGSVGNFITSDSSSRALPADLTKYLHLSLNKELNDLGSDTKKELGLQNKKEELIDKVKDLSKEQLIEYLKTDTSLEKLNN